MPQQKIWLTWNYNGSYPEQGEIIWNLNDFIWSEVYILITVAQNFGGGGGGLILRPDKTWKDIEKQFKKKNISDEETKKFLEIVVRVNGLNKTEVREINKIKKMITVDHIKKVLTEYIPTVTVTADDVKKS